MHAPIGITVAAAASTISPALSGGTANLGAITASSLGTTVTIQSHDTRGTCGWCTTDTTYVNSAEDVKRALQELPNGVISTSVQVAMNGAGLGRYGYTITFGAGNTGDQNEITMQAAGRATRACTSSSSKCTAPAPSRPATVCTRTS